MISVPQGWEINRLGEVAKINMGQSPDSDFVNEQREGIAFLQGNAEFGEIHPSEKYWVTEPKKVADCGEILISVRAPVGEINRADKPYCIGRGLASIKISKLDQEYGFYAFSMAKEQLNRLAQGSTFLAISKDDLVVTSILIPPKNEQLKIASILSGIDRAIEATQTLIDKEKMIKKALMADLLNHGIDEHGRIRTPQTHRYVESSLGMIPEGWEVVELQENFEYISYGFTNPMPTTEVGPFMVTATDIKNGQISYQTCRRTSQEAYDSLLTKKSKPIKNDILLTKDGSLGRIALMDDAIVCINQSVALLRPKKSQNPIFLKHLLESPMYQKKMLHDAGGSTIKHIYITVVDKMKIMKPILTNEQNQIATILSAQDRKIEIEEANLAKLQNLKKALMVDLLSGKVRVKV